MTLFAFLGVDTLFEDSNEGERSVLLVVVHSVAHHPLVGNLEAGILDVEVLHPDLQPGGLLKQNAAVQ